MLALAWAISKLKTLKISWKPFAEVTVLKMSCSLVADAVESAATGGPTLEEFA